MQVKIDAEYQKFIHEAEAEDAASNDTSSNWLKVFKYRLFGLFFKLNKLKIPLPTHYHMLIIAIEALQILTFVFNDGNYNQLGPYGVSSPWSLQQTQWFIDLCWAFRIDRYFRISSSGLVVLLSLLSFFIGGTIGLAVLLAWDRRITKIYSILTKVLKALITLLTDLLFIPIIDTFAFGMRCSYKTHSECLGLPENYLGVIMFSLATALYLVIAGLCTIFYYDFCQACGNIMSKPHSRIKLLRLGNFVVVIFSSYFLAPMTNMTLFLIVCLLVSLTESFIYIYYLPYYNQRMCYLRMFSPVILGSAAFCILIGEIFNSSEQSRSSVSMLFYFLTPCLVQVTQLSMENLSKRISERKIQELANPFQVEIKARILIYELNASAAKNAMSLFDDTNSAQEFEATQARIKEEIESLYSEAFRKFPTSELLYLWSGLFQLHFYSNCILAMVRCFKGTLLANKLDTQFMFYQFKRTSESFYKANMKDDAYDFVMFEKCFSEAQKKDEAVTRSQYYFWAELESKQPKIDKLVKLSGDTAKMISVAKANYQRLLQLNSKSTSAMRMFGHFLSNLNSYSDVGQRYLQKADMQEESANKSSNSNTANNLTLPLSFFDSENLILKISADLETIGEILKVNSVACTLLGYLQAELIGRNISLLIPAPFAENHDNYMRKFHEFGEYTVIDNTNLVAFFLSKAGHILEARVLVKVVPNHVSAPFFMAVIKPTNPQYEIILTTNEFVITAFTEKCTTLFELSPLKSDHQKLQNILPTFENLQEEMSSDQGVVISHTYQAKTISLKLKLENLILGKNSCKVIKLIVLEAYDRESSTRHELVDLGCIERAVTDFSKMRSISVLQSVAKESSVEDAQVLKTESASSLIEKEPGITESFSYEYESGESSLIQSQNVAPLSDLDALSHLLEEITNSEKSRSISSSSSHEPADFINDSSHLKSEPEIHSPHSSSKSMNSSITSVAHFNKGIKALVSLETSKTKKHVTRFKVALILTIIVLIFTSVLTFSVVGKSVDTSKRLSHYVNLVGELRFHTISLSYFARQLSLIDISFAASTNRNEMFTWMSEDVLDMHNIIIKLHKNTDLIKKSDSKIYTSEDISTWHLEGSSTRKVQSNLFDAMTYFILQGYLIQDEMQNNVIGLNNLRVYYIYRNGNGETLRKLNSSAVFYETSAQEYLEGERLTAILLILSSVFLLILCAIVAIIPGLRKIEKSKHEVLEMFFEIPSYICRVMKAKCSDRLNLLSDTANIDLDYEEDEVIVSGGLRDEDKREKDIEADENNPKKANKRSKEEIYDKHQRRVQVLKLICFFSFSLVYFYLIYYISYEAVGNLIKEEPVQVNWASRRKQLSREINMWVNEALLTNITELGSKFIAPNNQNIGDPLLHAEKAVNELEFVQNSLIFGNSDVDITYTDIRSTAHEDLLFQNGCVAPIVRSKTDCDSVGNKVMMQGLHSAISSYITLARTILQTIRMLSANNTLTYSTAKDYFHSSDMQLLRDLDNYYLYDPLRESSILYEEDFNDSEQQMRLWQNVLMAVYCAASLMFYLFMYCPMIDQLGAETKNSWSMCALIPQEYQDELKKLNEIIRTRKDEFKWK